MLHLEVLVELGSVYDSVYEGLRNQVGNNIAFLGRRDTGGNVWMRHAYNNGKTQLLTKTDSLCTTHTISRRMKGYREYIYIPI